MKKTSRRKGGLAGRVNVRRVLLAVGAMLACFYAAILIALFLLRWIDPPFTAVQAERRVASWFSGQPYRKSYQPVSLHEISPNLVHACIAAEDTRFFQHHGFDWKEMGNAVEDGMEGGHPRGASTITQQLVRNLFLSTGRSVFRKALEFSIVPLAEIVLTKNRILELYLNVIEWGPGVYGAEASACHYYQVPAARLNSEQGADLAAMLPAPLHRRPGQPRWYVARIHTRMRQMGW
jgi:monofunctional biosynthetic peptidoglycan transglycosylase